MTADAQRGVEAPQRWLPAAARSEAGAERARATLDTLRSEVESEVSEGVQGWARESWANRGRWRPRILKDPRFGSAFKKLDGVRAAGLKYGKRLARKVPTARLRQGAVDSVRQALLARPDKKVAAVGNLARLGKLAKFGKLARLGPGSLLKVAEVGWDSYQLFRKAGSGATSQAEILRERNKFFGQVVGSAVGFFVPLPGAAFVLGTVGGKIGEWLADRSLSALEREHQVHIADFVYGLYGVDSGPDVAPAGGR